MQKIKNSTATVSNYNFIKKILIYLSILVSTLLISSCWNNSQVVNSEVITNNSSTDIITSEKKEQKIILALWDSLTAWYNLDISESYPNQLSTLLIDNWYNYKVINAWVSGDTSKNLLDRISLYDDINPDIYILAIWWNDGLRKLPTSNLQDNIELLIAHLEKINPESTIVLTWMQIPLNAWIDYSNNFKQLYIDIKNIKEEIFLFPFLLEWVATKKELNLSDWIHPNTDWYSIIANNIFTYLQDNNLLQK